MPSVVLSGFNHIPPRVQRLVRKKLKADDEVILEPDPNNQHDPTAVKVFFQGHQIGWIAKNCIDKEYVFQKLMAGKNNIGNCISNEMKSGSSGRFRAIEIFIDFTTKRAT
jgi:hypothetical protein